MPLLNYKVDSPDKAEKLVVGDVVKSYDFEGRDDCYVLGIIGGMDEIDGCPRYIVKPLDRIWAGKVSGQPLPAEFIPPVNGTPCMMGGYTNFVRKATDERSDMWREKLRDHAEDLRGDY